MHIFWQDLPHPFFVLAPMDGVTDVIFRHVVTRAAKPDVYFTEFTNTDSFCSPKGKESTANRLAFTSDEQPLVAQIWGTNPEHFAQMAKGLKEAGFAGVDINMGCPVKDVTKKGACSALIETPSLAAEIIAATKEGGLPISVKTRTGFKQQKTEEWVSFLLQQDIAALSLHARTAKEMSKVPAHWEEVALAVKLRDAIAPRTCIVGNGDVIDYRDGLRRVEETGADGIMIGRGVFQNVFCFEKEPKDHTLKESIDLLHYHLDLFDRTWKEHPYPSLKRFFKVYIKGFASASEIREHLMQTHSTLEARQVLNLYCQPMLSTVTVHDEGKA